MTATIIEVLIFTLLAIFAPPRNANNDGFLKFGQTNSIRGIAILIIVLMHSSCNLGMRVFTPCGGIGVALFLILSGYGLSESFKKKRCNGFWQNKVRKLWIPYAVVLTVVKIWSVVINDDVLSVLPLANNSFYGHAILQYVCIDSPFWYISFLFYNYVLFYICHRYSRLYKYRYALFIAWGCLLFFFDTRIRAEQCMCFVTGMWLSENKDTVYRYIGKKRESFCLVSVLLIVSGAALFAKQIPALRNVVEHERLVQNGIEFLIKYPFALAFIGLFSVCSILWRNRIWAILIGNRFLTYCSTISLELYLVHFSLIPLLDKEKPIWSLAVFLVLSFGLSTILHYTNKYIFLWKK